MSVALIVLIAACAILLGCLVLAMVRIFDLMDEREEDNDHTHAKCLSMVAAFIGDEFAAQVLNAAATDYDTAEGQAQLAVMRDRVWVHDGPSMPSLWLRNRAEMILERHDY